MIDDGDQLIVEKNSDSIEMGRHRLSGRQSAARLNVSARGLHSCQRPRNITCSMVAPLRKSAVAPP